MAFPDELTSLAQKFTRTVVFAEAADVRMIRAAHKLVQQKVTKVILTGCEQAIRAIAHDANLSLHGIEVIDPEFDSKYIQQFIVEARSEIPRPLNDNLAEEQMRQALMFGAMMVRLRHADALVAGATVTTGDVIRAALKIFGTDSNTNTASSYFLMLVPKTADQLERTLIFADCAVNVEPSAQQLAEIAIATERNARSLLKDEPKVAMLSFSSKGSANHPIVKKVTQALSLVKDQHPDMMIDGELQFDAAVDANTAKHKLSEPSLVAGAANILIFPDLNSGNIGYKIARFWGNIQAIGPILQGFAFPISDLSRSASTEDIFNTTVVLLATLNDA